MSQRITAKTRFVYDDRGSLSIFETDMAGRMTNGTYEYDILGRLTHKAEAGSDIIFDYVDGSYRPVSVSVNGQEIDRALAFDQAGNLWLNGVSNVAYKLNGAGLPEKALSYGEALPADISLDQVDAGAVATAGSTVAYEYDGATRIYERRDVNGEFASGRVTVPGFGSYTRGPETGFSIERLDLPGGGYRTGADGAALFPLTDAQGSIRGYANLSGVRSAHAYYPYGSVEDLSNDAPEDARRWQSKEYDGDLGNYYFGARYYDPLLGMWMTPDPAGQFSNPYGYGGDPVNYVDPTGMWALGLGLVVGWDEEHGWQFGVGAALDLSKSSSGNGFRANLMYTWNQDDSEGFNVSASGQYYCFTAGLSYSYNSYTGQTLSGNVGVCFGVKGIVCAGAEAGGTLYWDHWGDFMGATAYAEFQASAFGGFASAAFGGETGAGSVEGRGLFAGATVAGVHAEVSERDGRSLSFQRTFDIGKYDSRKGWEFSNTAKTVGGLFALDLNQSILAMSWQLLSRFTWELPQTALGLGLGILASELGIVDNVDYFKGATLIRYGIDIKGAFTVGSFIAGNNLYLTKKELNERGLEGRPLLRHEYGHVIQSRLVGLFYLPFIALPSIIDSALDPKNHDTRSYEVEATEFGKKYIP